MSPTSSDSPPVSPDPSLWRGRRVLVTGHTGFKGAWLSIWLDRLGAELTGYALAPPTTPALFDAARVGELIDDRRADVRRLDAVVDAFAAAAPSVVFHLAAQSLVRASYEDPVETYATNVQGTVHVLEAARRTPSVEAVVVVTTDKCYENREQVWPYREIDPMGGHDPYSSSKGCAELVTAAYRASFGAAGPRIASARAGNVIGGGDWARDRLLPDLVRGGLAGETVRIRNPSAVRPWQHVLEPLSGYLRLAEALLAEDGGRYAGGWNFGPDPGDARPVGWIVRRMAERWPGLAWREDPGPHPHEAHMLALDVSKARALLGWRPRLGLEEALAWLVGWYRDVDAGADPRAACEARIDRYAAAQDAS